MGFGKDQRMLRALEALQAGDVRGYIGEPVSQLEHALQCASLAHRANASTFEVVAALFHDIGHLIAPAGSPEMDGLGICDHERIGARWLCELGFDARVCELVASHVEAKRYLAWRKKGYYEALSEASRGTLRFQGGPMNEQQARDFENDPLFASKTRLRMWDEAAKDSEHDVPALPAYVERVRIHMSEVCPEVHAVHAVHEVYEPVE
jgi:putative nucleotidyltransferase with HDIG domain